MLKAQEELDYKPGIYTQWESAYNMEDNICGCYISMEEFIKSPDNTVEKEFEVIIPIDDLLPFAAMKMFPNALFGNLTLEVKMAIQQNFVICQCKQETILNKISHISSSSYSGSDEIKDNITEVIKSDIYNIIKRNGEYHAFTQIGDSFNVHSFTGALRESQNIIVGKDTTVSFMITDGSLKYCRTNINGFNIKDSILNELIEKYQTKELIIPSQYVDYQAFSQKPMTNGLKCNTTYAMTNVKYNEIDTNSIIGKAGNGKYIPPLKDNTSYCFLCSTERLSGYGTFCDGITKDNAHVTLSGTLLIPNNEHPYITNPLTKESNDRCPIMLVCQDCFWRCTLQGGCEYICNNKYFVKEKTGTD
ncbi:hypothetical protein EDI_347210 [Entamoeba dispar SAW760]|uniref:Uncharacterized protein n=1 Tax=Entamoeba dispar (strain ATCC PRA-260 / SAW760) TaxID=370354 RepID=B0EM46_ENTDS|nr:uncharacterized protein EDI_347210 [Entamoeba dispar SAW760]EDR24401.1 hypothetical protein EDI_347210 [Entamoeba dispar SAW760]|eukprot:EDR24401.1 hypothetical protein EDI_347210 [Entamoeba dispar SAW760]